MEKVEVTGLHLIWTQGPCRYCKGLKNRKLR